MALEKVYRRNQDIVARPILDEVLLVPVRGELADLPKIFMLSQVAQHIWEQIDGERDLAALRDGLVARFEVDQVQAQADLLEFVEQLASAGLVDEVPST